MSFARVALFLPSLAGGGTERVFVDLANQFVRLDVGVDLVLANAHGPYLPEVSTSVRVVDLGAQTVSSAFPRLVRHLRTERPDALLSGLDHANVIAVLAHLASLKTARCVISTRSVPTVAFRESQVSRGRVVLRAARVLYRFADAIVANSAGVAADLARFLPISAERISVVHNPLDADSIQALSRERVIHGWCADGSPPLILSAGRFDVLKDFPTLVRAFGLVRSRRDCHLVILGEGPGRASLESLIAELGLAGDVHLPGFVFNPYPWMRRADVFVSSSLSEGCPNALMQALACGTPVVSTDSIGGSAEILEQGKWGRLVPVGDAVAMAKCMEATLDASVHPDVMRRAQDFSPRRIAREYLRILIPHHISTAMAEQG